MSYRGTEFEGAKGRRRRKKTSHTSKFGDIPEEIELRISPKSPPDGGMKSNEISYVPCSRQSDELNNGYLTSVCAGAAILKDVVM